MSTIAHPPLNDAGAPRRYSVTARTARTTYSLPVPLDSRQTMARAWLWLGLLAIAGSGLFSILLVLSRTPVVNGLLPGVDFFRTALVVHVDLSVLVWFIAIAGLMWSISGRGTFLSLGWVAMVLTCLGTVAMAAAAFTSDPQPVMANYIPVLDNRIFLAGLIAVAAGAGLLVLRALLAAPATGALIDGHAALRFGISAAAVASAVALLAFVWSYLVLPHSLVGKAYYEILFWGGGHALQFVWTLLMLVCWLWLGSASGAPTLLSPRLAVLMFALALIAVFVTPYAYLAYDIATVEHRNLHTWAMRLGGGLAIVPITLAVVEGLLRSRAPDAAAKPVRASLIASMLLFASGGIIGALIHGNNVKIPAHYHGCIVGVTLAFMGLVYHLLPQLGYRAARGRLAVAQPYIYGLGQLLHIIGLVWSGGYGVQRKVAGADQVLRTAGETAGMGLMGLGGLLAIIGGMLFVVIVLRAMLARPECARQGA